MLASQAPAVRGIAAHVQRGGLVIGICNGFQILVESGLLPGALSYNDPPGFCHRWLTLRVTEARPSPWFSGIAPGTELRMPMAHGEGCFFHPDGETALGGSVPLVYTKNPNGSLADAAGLLDETGHILGLMPHPERASEPDLGSSDGMRLFSSAHAYLSQGTR
jgi:phosphoribosylformylglycinamidine synthase